MTDPQIFLILHEFDQHIGTFNIYMCYTIKNVNVREPSRDKRGPQIWLDMKLGQS